MAKTEEVAQTGEADRMRGRRSTGEAAQTGEAIQNVEVALSGGPHLSSVRMPSFRLQHESSSHVFGNFVRHPLDDAFPAQFLHTFHTIGATTSSCPQEDCS
jgi:hypothetical protein